MCGNTTRQCDGILGWGLWKVIKSYGWSPHDGISALISRGTRELASSLLVLCHVRTQQEDCHLQTKESPHQNVTRLNLDLRLSSL